MTERIDYDDDPAGTAAVKWLKTPAGRVAAPDGLPGFRGRAIYKAFRCGYIIGNKSTREAAKKATKEGEQDAPG